MSIILLFFLIKKWWERVTVTPEARRTVVLSRGTWNGLIAFTPSGGHKSPISIFGLRLLWKKLQKKEKKNKTSEVINKIMPHRNPFITRFECSPWKDPSRDTSRHHWKQKRIKHKLLNPDTDKFLVDIIKTLLIRNLLALRLTRIGHGLRKTKWKGWNWDIISFVYIHGE